MVDLLVDQIEFANVILLNKIDLCDAETVDKAERLVRKLNPFAEVYRTSHGEIPISCVMKTGLFDMAKAAMAPGWLQSLQEKHVPETVEYGIGSFIYRRRRPFHPERLCDLLDGHFMVLEDYDDDDIDMDSDESIEQDDMGLMQPARMGFEGLFRSKGFFWLASRPDSMGDWGQAGCTITIRDGGNWFACIDPNQWPVDTDEERQLILDDFDSEVGDRRQEIVFIGQLTEERRKFVEESLDACLLTDTEWAEYKNGGEFPDPWAPWPSMFAEED